MKDLLLLSLRKFLEARLVPGKPLLLGYSGGPDSKALLYLLQECRRLFPFDLLLAHVDHGWRPESKAEALKLQKEAEGLQLPFYLKKLDPQALKEVNLEEQGRKARLEFFSQIYREKDCQALLLGHHADDQAEVVLKRVFEGASLFSLGGVTEERILGEMNLWRPLIGTPKKTLLQWLERRGLAYFIDPSNFSSQNLRGKMRQHLLPSLSQAFGKEISLNLCWLGEEAKQLQKYFFELNQPILTSLQKTPDGFHLDLRPFLPMPPMQMKYLLKECLSSEAIALSREILHEIMALLSKSDLSKKIPVRQGELQVEQGYLSFKKQL